MALHRLQIIIDFFIMPFGGSLAFLYLSWSWLRVVRGGRPLTSVMKGVLRYSFWGALGMIYIFAGGSAVGWPIHTWYAISFLWFALLGFFAYWRHRSKGTPVRQKEPGGPDPITS